MEKRKILVVDDSALMRRTESDILNSDSRFTVVGTCFNGLDAFDTVMKDPTAYDLVLIEINLPKMTGLEFLAALKKNKISVKTIIISSNLKLDSKETIQALQLGAFDFVSKPENFLDLKSDSFKSQLLDKVALATRVTHFGTYTRTEPLKETPAEVRRPEGVTKPSIRPATGTSEVGKVVSPMNAQDILAAITTPRRPHTIVPMNAKKLVLIAVSTGGPRALQTVIPGLPKNINAPVLLVQHMSSGFTKSLADRLNSESTIDVIEASHGTVIEKGKVYLAKGGAQMRLKKNGSDYVIDENTEEPARSSLKPCADILFESIAGMDFDEIICCVLTGMGGDGTMGIHALTQRNNCYVIAQDERTSTVYGMPKVVFEAGLTDSVKPLEDVAKEITNITGVINYGC